MLIIEWGSKIQWAWGVWFLDLYGHGWHLLRRALVMCWRNCLDQCIFIRLITSLWCKTYLHLSGKTHMYVRWKRDTVNNIWVQKFMWARGGVDRSLFWKIVRDPESRDEESDGMVRSLRIGIFRSSWRQNIQCFHVKKQVHIPFLRDATPLCSIWPSRAKVHLSETPPNFVRRRPRCWLCFVDNLSRT